MRNTEKGVPINTCFIRIGMLAVIALLCAQWRICAASPSPDTPGKAGLIDKSSLVYLGAFRVPQVSGPSGATFAWAGSGLAYYPAHNSLFMTGHSHHQLVGEISIPAYKNTPSLAALPIATLLQPLEDITEGNRGAIGIKGAKGEVPANARIGGLLVVDDKLLGTIYAWYEGAEFARRSHFLSGLILATHGDFSGVYIVGAQNPGLVAGYMTPVPPEFREKLGGSILTGQACIPIISRSSFGPAICAMNPRDLSKSGAAKTVPLLYYPESHPTLGAYNNEKEARPLYNMTTRISGVVFPAGFRSVLFFGRTGMGIPRYGAGTGDRKLDGTKVPGYDEDYAYDPANPLSKGTHAWPYSYYVWAYDADDLAAVASGRKKPWEVLPAGHWPLRLPYIKDSVNSCEIGGVASDPRTGRIFISQLLADKDRPVIHVFAIRKQ